VKKQRSTLEKESFIDTQYLLKTLHYPALDAFEQCALSNSDYSFCVNHFSVPHSDYTFFDNHPTLSNSDYSFCVNHFSVPHSDYTFFDIHLTLSDRTTVFVLNTSRN
jgi:hypothetical protein